jgi:hypothetical protein
MDIETYEENTKVIPYLFILVDNKENFFYFYGDVDKIITDFLNQIEILATTTESIEVYTHNINFDGYILLEYFLAKSFPFE